MNLQAAEHMVVVDDHPLFREALAGTLRRMHPQCRVSEMASFEQLQELLEADSAIDLVLLDLHLPGRHGLSALAWMRGRYPEIPVLLISAHDDTRIIQRAIADGAAGFLSKSADSETIDQAIDRVLDGDTWVPAGLEPRERDPGELELVQKIGALTPQQYRILMMLGEGLLNKQIAWELDITEATVKAHMTAIMRKLDVSNRTQAVTLLNRLQVSPKAFEQDSP
ncbi:response regulator transcription factor [Wenzhouxiangella sediminis]|uniref:DNA-binding response regulator n=1 Tax=Wenzhouxiangella sediminis TaxID=1792836 RepID=A0A3E1KBU7_9GAMM|nr:response regulator transcription factor [Wenzhouxiangella sediminis]RFF31525.1 DNA-binding response regulator [Wenzhouxiangella sediminis]